MSAIQLTPYQAEQKKVAIAKGVILGVALAVLATFAALHRDSLFMFMKEHTTFSMFLLPAAAAGLLMGPAMNELKKKKQIVLALTVALAALAVLAHYVLGNTLLQNTTLAFGGGLLTYFMFNSKEKDPELDKYGMSLMSPLVDFAYGDVNGEWKEIHWEARYPKRIPIDPQADNISSPKVGDIITVKSEKRISYYKVSSVEKDRYYGYTQYKGLYSTSQKRVDAEGNTFYPVYYYDPIGKKKKMGATVWPALIFRAVGGIVFDILTLPLYVIYLVGRLLCYDIWKSNDRAELLGNRFFEILNVFRENVECVGKNAFCAVAGTIASWGMAIEGVKHGRPMNAQKALAKIEQIQNGISLHRSYWSIMGRQNNFQGIAGDLKMDEDQKMRVGEHGFYVLGCCQPLNILKVSKGETTILANWSNSKEYQQVKIKDHELSSHEDWDPTITSYSYKP